MRLLLVPLLISTLSPLPAWLTQEAVEGQLDGYLGAPNQGGDSDHGAGFSMYVAAWPLLERYPGSRFQSGLFGTWMFARLDEPKPEGQLYSDIEGGLGWWRDTRFATETPKFIMGGVALNFSAWANGPGAGKGRDWDVPAGKYGVAQLSPWLVWPPDGLNLKQGTCGQLFGYGYLPLPLTAPQARTGGKDVPTGNQCWTLFLNTANFKGPVAFFTPYFFSSATEERPDLAGLFLDSRPSDPHRALQMETQYVPAVVANDSRHGTYARIAPTRFPVNKDGESILIHQVSSYDRGALWDAVKAWFEGGAEASGKIDAAHAIFHTFPGQGWSTWRIYASDAPEDDRIGLDWSQFATPVVQDAHTFGYRWEKELVEKTRPEPGSLVRLPEYYRLEGDGEARRWQPLRSGEIPPSRLLRELEIGEPQRTPSEPYTTPDEGCWVEPGPVAGPFTVTPGDGSVVTYCWYRFADQPALFNADLSPEERESIQKRVEQLHRLWTREREYLPPPTVGELAELDPVLIVEPPPGLEIGYVPIVIRQEAR